jgi:sarcosine oxidase subunit alpha
MEQTAHWGGRAVVDGGEIGGRTEDFVNDSLELLARWTM